LGLLIEALFLKPKRKFIEVKILLQNLKRWITCRFDAAHRTTAAECCAGLPAWASPHLCN